MFVNLQRFFLLTIGFLFFMLGCGPDSNDILLGVSDLIQSSLREEENVAPTEAADVAPVSNAQVSFERDLQPILSARCAFAGCHVAGGPHGLNFSTYESFIRGGNDGPVFTPGNARSSDIVEEIVSGRMPIGGPQLTNAEIQLFIDWINSQAAIPNRPVNEPPETQTPEFTDGRVSFEQHLLPILTARCAYSGCHDANGYDGLDFRTYQSFIRGDYEGESVFIPGNARSSDIIEEIVSGRMPVGGPRLSNAQIQLFRDWINQQDRADFPNLRYDDDEDDDHDHDDHDDHDDDDDPDDDEDDEDDRGRRG